MFFCRTFVVKTRAVIELDGWNARGRWRCSTAVTPRSTRPLCTQPTTAAPRGCTAQCPNGRVCFGTEQCCVGDGTWTGRPCLRWHYINRWCFVTAWLPASLRDDIICCCETGVAYLFMHQERVKPVNDFLELESVLWHSCFYLRLFAQRKLWIITKHYTSGTGPPGTKVH